MSGEDSDDMPIEAGEAAAEPEPPPPPPPPKSADGVKALGNAAFKAGKHREAIAHYTEAIELDGAQPSFYSNRAMTYLKIGEYRLAVRDGLKASEVDPAFAKGWLRAAQGATSTGDFGAAAEYYGKVLELDPSIVEAVSGRQLAREAEEKATQAEALIGQEEFGRAVAMVAPLIHRVGADNARLGVLHLQALVGDRKYVRGTEMSMGLIKKVGQTPALMTLRGECLLYTGNTESAKQHLQKALRDEPDLAKAQVLYKHVKKMEEAKNVANALYKQGKYVDAHAAYGEALLVDPAAKDFNAALYCNRGNANLKMRQWKDALGDAEEAIKLVPTYAKAFGELVSRPAGGHSHSPARSQYCSPLSNLRGRAIDP
eukprot:SAG22_NODE_192_length_15668_cov_4.492389_10_plen_371_part_00